MGLLPSVPPPLGSTQSSTHVRILRPAGVRRRRLRPLVYCYEYNGYAILTFIDYELKMLHRLQQIECYGCTYADNFLAQLHPDIRVTS